MALVPPHVAGPLSRLVADIGKHLRRPMQVEWDTSPHGDPCAWLTVLEADESRRVASLTIRQKGPTATYAVRRLDDQGAGHRSAALATALRDLQVVAVAALKSLAPPTNSAEDDDRKRLGAPMSTIAPPPCATNAPTFTAVQAVEHPGIRAAILAGNQIEATTGRRPATGDLVSIVNAALPVVARISEVYKPQRSAEDPEGAGWSERVLMGLLLAAIGAAAPAPSA